MTDLAHRRVEVRSSASMRPNHRAKICAGTLTWQRRRAMLPLWSPMSSTSSVEQLSGPYDVREPYGTRARRACGNSPSKIASVLSATPDAGAPRIACALVSGGRLLCVCRVVRAYTYAILCDVRSRRRALSWSAGCAGTWSTFGAEQCRSDIASPAHQYFTLYGTVATNDRHRIRYRTRRRD
jgi:hypothetical protein